MSAIKEIIGLMTFTPWVTKDTRMGPRLIRTAQLTNPFVHKQFWASWNKDRSAWYELGYGVSKAEGWILGQYLNPNGTVTAQALEMAAKAREEKGEGALPADWIPNDVTLGTPQAEKLLGYQRPAAMRLKRALGIGNALDASETGVGKTYVALAVAAELGMTPCVIAPLAVLPSWQRAAQMMGVRMGWLVNYEKIRTGKSGLGRWKKACEFEPGARGDRFVYEYLPGKAPLLILDEAHKAKSPDTKQGQLLRDAARAGHRILCLSATAAKDPTEMRNLGAALGLHDGSHKAFEAFCLANGCRATSWGMKFDNKNRKLLERLHRQIFPLKGNRIRIADLPDFPETQILAETLTCETDAISAAYSEMERTLQKLQASDLSGSEKHVEGMAAVMKARKTAEGGKLKLFAELASEAIEEGRSVVVFLNFIHHVKAMMEALKTDCVVWGHQKPDERQLCIDQFNRDERRSIVISLQAGGAGLSLHDLNGNFPRMSIISPSYSAVDLKQALGRVHRAGALTKSFQRIIFAADTIEEEICASVREKLINVDLINDGTLAPPSILKNALPSEAGGAELVLA